MKIFVIILLVIGLFSLTIEKENGKKIYFGFSLITNTIILILIFLGKIFF